MAYFPEGRVYFLKAEGIPMVKIGRTTGDVWKRRNQIQSMSPVKLHKIGIIAGGSSKELEKRMHDIFSPYRVWGEWFKFSSKAVSSLKKCFRGDGRFDISSFENYWRREGNKLDSWV